MRAIYLRARLASFPHAYAVAIRLREQTGLRQYVISSPNPLQPVRVSAAPPRRADQLMALVA
jgi:hypothetical protein